MRSICWVDLIRPVSVCHAILLILKMRIFIKTGSGQTYGSSRSDAFFVYTSCSRGSMTMTIRRRGQEVAARRRRRRVLWCTTSWLHSASSRWNKTIHTETNHKTNQNDWQNKTIDKTQQKSNTIKTELLDLQHESAWTNLTRTCVARVWLRCICVLTHDSMFYIN